MAVPRIMVGGETVSSISVSRSGSRSASPVGWNLLGLLGAALLVVGGVDLGLTWFPLRIGNPEWEFGTITAVLNNMPVPLLGLTLLLVSAVAGGSLVWTRVLSIVLLVWAVLTVAMAVIYGLTLPLAAKGFEVPDVGYGLKRAIGKTLAQLVVYPVVMFLMGVRGLKLARSINS